ncbi:protein OVEREXPRESSOR OF CATIONIC PEROXIDASE 3 isoform X2 [Andrographis paniculata]|uniref:protein OVEREXPRESSOR OF CATIONIC PEROXIDASE 3 isoform X2 n=1 Tax=Andrographis paniculata TaxID=175694 RepID=UPI0021E96D7B|nr:protein OVEREXPRESSOR OF CATIONIC PEROXIDASE 3 isoform X2 [Andrographis paniculata]
MASLTALQTFHTLQCASSNSDVFPLCNHKSPLKNFFRPSPQPLRSLCLCLSSHRSRRNSNPSVSSKQPKKRKTTKKRVEEDEDEDEDALEALFSQLGEDLKNDELYGTEDDDDDDDISDEELTKLAQNLAEALVDEDDDISDDDDGISDDDDDISDEDDVISDEELAKLEQELAEALAGEDDDISDEELAKLEQELAEAVKDDKIFGALNSATIEDVSEEEDDDNDDEGGYEVGDDNEEEERSVNLKNWQLRRLAYALKDGRRKTRVKNLAADLCLDRAVVLRLLRDPPPNLVMLSATLPDKPDSTISGTMKEVEAVSLETETSTTKPEVKAEVPVHVKQHNWSAKKRLKKMQLQTLEQVYERSKRPTNAMVSSIVQLTNLPRKRVVKWFEDRRAEDGVPERRLPYQLKRQ